MKKVMLLLVVMLSAGFLVACGDTDSSSSDNNTDDAATKDNEAASKEVSDTHLETGDYVYEVKDIEQLDGKYDDGTQIIAVEVTFTNNSDEATSPWMAVGIGAEQETDTTVELLDGANGQFPDDYKPDLVEMGDSNVKPGATVDAIIGFTLEYPGEPVRLYEMRAISDEDNSFERIVETE